MSRAYNPYLPAYEYVPDGEPHIFDGRLYVFGSHDRYNGTDYCENDYVAWSAPLENLGDWRYEGIIFRKEQDPRNMEYRKPLQAPDVVCRGGKYYLYYCPAGLGCMGVAVCDRPGGRYEFLGYVRHPDDTLLGEKRQDGFPFDPGVFQDEDGRVWLYFGFTPMNPQMEAFTNSEGLWKSGPFAAEVSADMQTLAGKIVPVEIIGCPGREHAFFEASSMRKINGKYYFIYSSQSSHELCYAVGTQPAGPFYYGGVLYSNGDIGMPGITEECRKNYTGNNHGSLVEINGQWYVFGHRITNYTLFSRQGVAEPVTIAADGHIGQAEMTSGGLGGDLPWQGRFEARIACLLWAKEGAVHCNTSKEALEQMKRVHPAFVQSGADREYDPDQYITNLRDGAAAGFRYFEVCGQRRICVETRGDAGSMKIYTADGAMAARIPLSAGREWHESEMTALNVPAGRQTLLFVYCGNGAVDFRAFVLKE